MSIFVLSISAWVLFVSAFSLWLTLSVINDVKKNLPELLYKKCVLKNVENLQGSTCAIGLFNKATLLKKWLWHRCFPVNFAEFLRTAFLQNTGRLLQGVKKLNKQIRLNWAIRLVLTIALRTAKNQWTSKGGRKVSI